VSSLLGRPSATGAARVPAKGQSQSDSNTISPSSPPSSVDATYRLLVMLDLIEESIYRQHVTSVSSANHLLETLKTWSNEVQREPLMHVSASESDQHTVLGNMHVSCSYYYAVILITRPYFMHHLMIDLITQSKLKTDGLSEPIELDSGPTDPGISELAQTCEDAAIFMLSGCNEILQAGMLLHNMCLTQ
jgi:hypothetical protein